MDGCTVDSILDSITEMVKCTIYERKQTGEEKYRTDITEPLLRVDEFDDRINSLYFWSVPIMVDMMKVNNMFKRHAWSRRFLRCDLSFSITSPIA